MIARRAPDDCKPLHLGSSADNPRLAERAALMTRAKKRDIDRGPERVRIVPRQERARRHAVVDRPGGGFAGSHLEQQSAVRTTRNGGGRLGRGAVVAIATDPSDEES